MSQLYSDSIFWIEVGKINPNPYQPRKEFNQEALNALSESIRQYGVLQPLVVTRQEKQKPDGGIIVEYELIAGERRLRAARLAGIAQVPVVIRTGEDNNLMKLELAIIENLQREDLNPVDRARAFQKFVDEFHYKHAEIAKKIGKSREYVSNSLRLLTLPEEILTALVQEKITEGHARPLMMLNDRPEEQMTLFKEALYKKLTVRDVVGIARRIAKDKVRKKTRQFDPEILKIERDLTEQLGTRVHIEQREIGGKITIEFFSDDDLKSLLAFMQEAQNPNEKTNSILSYEKDNFPVEESKKEIDEELEGELEEKYGTGETEEVKKEAELKENSIEESKEEIEDNEKEIGEPYNKEDSKEEEVNPWEPKENVEISNEEKNGEEIKTDGLEMLKEQTVTAEPVSDFSEEKMDIYSKPASVEEFVSEEVNVPETDIPKQEDVNSELGEQIKQEEQIEQVVPVKQEEVGVEDLSYNSDAIDKELISGKTEELVEEPVEEFKKVSDAFEAHLMGIVENNEETGQKIEEPTLIEAPLEEEPSPKNIIVPEEKIEIPQVLSVSQAPEEVLYESQENSEEQKEAFPVPLKDNSVPRKEESTQSKTLSSGNDEDELYSISNFSL